jgi:hypothetical protein
VIEIAGLVLASTTILAGCTATADPEDPAPTQAPDEVLDTPDGNPTVDDSAEGIPSADGIPQELHQGVIDPITAADVVLIDDGDVEYAMQVIDPATGAVKTRIVTGPGIDGPVVHPFVGETPSDPAVLAAEIWRPRGSRGAADFTISTYSGTLLEPRELLMADDTRLHSTRGSSVVTEDGEYFVAWDDALYGVRVFDLDAGKETGSLAVLGCGPFTWAVGRDIFSVCENSRQLLHLAIQEDGSIEEVERAAVLPEDFASNRSASFGFDAAKALLVSANGDVFVFDFSGGLPTNGVSPVGNAGQDGGRFKEAVLNNPATSLAISYTDSEIHPEAEDAGDTVTVILSDPSSFATIQTLTTDSMGISSIDGFGYSVDGATLYVQGTGDDEEEEVTLIGFDAASGAETSRVTVPEFVGEAAGLLTPQVIG